MGTSGIYKPTVLVVSDEVVFHDLCRSALCLDSNCAIETATAIEAALRRITRGGVDVVVGDMTMTGSSAFDLLHSARQASFSKPEIILVAGQPGIEEERQALQNGARDYLPKPCHLHRLRQSLCTCFEELRLRHTLSLLTNRLRLSEKGQHLATLLDVEALLQEALAAALAETNHDVRGLAFQASKDGLGVVVSTGGLGETQAQKLSSVLLQQLPSLSRSTFIDTPLLPYDEPGNDFQHIWIFPLRGENAMQGALVLINAAGHNLPDPMPLEHLQYLGELVAVGFRNACRYQGVRELIYIDDLTGLYNHRYLQIALEREIRRAQRYGLFFSIAFIDLDYFKRVNDTYGHLVGSNMLREVGTILRRSVREIDLLFRYGGDEFTALLVGTDSDGAGIVAERIRAGLEAHPFNAGSGLTCQVTATIGFATYPTHTANRQHLIDLADQAMYRGKQSRNAICRALPDDVA